MKRYALFAGAMLALTTLATGQTIDVVGNPNSSPSGTALAKGNSYDVTTSVSLVQAEFWLGFSTPQLLTFYVYDCPTEFGTYNQLHSASFTVNGTGVGWYSSGPLSVPMIAGMHYIIAVSWSGSLTYYYSVGNSQPTSFGNHTHGYATGSDPLPASFSSTVNDQAIYHQRLTTTPLMGFADYQVNQPEATASINGVAGSAMTPAMPAVPLNNPASLLVTSTNAGAPWEIVFGLAPLVPATLGAPVGPQGQVVNVDLTDPTLAFLFDGFQSPPFQNLSIVFTPMAPATLSLQMAVVDPVAAIGIRLSQPSRVTLQ